jgi:hypothetical protein
MQKKRRRKSHAWAPLRCFSVHFSENFSSDLKSGGDTFMDPSSEKKLSAHRNNFYLFINSKNEILKPRLEKTKKYWSEDSHPSPKMHEGTAIFKNH